MDVLLIDDDPFAVQIIMHVLARSGAGDRIHVAADGDEALQMIAEAETLQMNPDAHIPRLVLLDYNLAPTGGMEILRQIRSSPRFGDASVIVMSGSEDQTQKRESLALGASDYFVKPVTFEEFEQLLLLINSHWHRNDQSRQEIGAG